MTTPLSAVAPSSRPGRLRSGEYPRVSRRSTEDLLDQARALSRLPVSLPVAWEFGELLSTAGVLPDTNHARATDMAPPRLRELARRLGVEKTKFWRMVQLHAMMTRLPWLRSCQNVRSAHVHAVRGLPLAQQNSLLRRVEDESWTCRELVSVMRFGERREVHAFVTSLEAVCSAMTQAARNSQRVPAPTSEQSSEVLRLLDSVSAHWRELDRATAPLRARLGKSKER